METDDFSFCGHETEVIGTAVLNKEFYEMLVLSCNNSHNCSEKVDNNGTISSNEKLITIDKTCDNFDKSEENEEGTSIININPHICIDSDMDFFEKVIMHAVYPKFYEEWMSSEKEPSEVEAFFLDQNWLTKELLHELQLFCPNSNVTIEENRTFESMCNTHFL